jgi:hypothetical protein
MFNLKRITTMAEETKTYVFGEGNGSGLGTGFIPGMLGGALTSGFGGFGNGFGGWGMNGIVDLFGLAIIASIFGWGNGGFGGFGNGAAGAGFLSNQLNNDAGRELIMNAIQGTDADIRALASATSTDFDTVKAGINSVNAAIASLAAQQGVSSLQIINAIQSGDATLGRQLCECCCENRLLTTQQGYESRIQTIEQTNQLGSQADRNTAAITGAIASLQTNMTKEFCDLKEREMQSKIDTQSDIITQLRGQLDNDRQTAQLYAAINPLQAKVNEIASKQPNTVPVQYPNLVAMNATPYAGSAIYPSYGSGFPYGNGYWN